MENIYDLIIIGSGPTGLYGAFYSGIRDMKCKVVDSLPEAGGQLTALYPKKYIFDVPGFTKVFAEDLAKNLTEQAGQFEVDYDYNEKITNLEIIEDNGRIFKLSGDKGTSHYAKSVVIAAGAGAFMPRKLDAQNIDELEGRGFYYFVKDPQIFRDQEILIIGGGDSAFDWSLNLHGIAKKITQIHRSDKFRAHEDTVNKVKELDVDLRPFFELKALHGEERVEGATIFDNRSGEELELKLDSVICNLGFITNLGPIKEWGLDIIKNSIEVTQTLNTNIEGIWAAGDICHYDGKLKLISTGFAEAAIAVNMAKNYIDPKAKVFPGHSSSKPSSFEK